ncbi:SCP2 sterol-binding domain-containing protein [Methylosinus sp. Sm6]|uniref:SCP2 sterol-binding domain-containing protein n=1 Tax=Methylosinus sp. Sm6 TaxID=2866948 RepID=UPI002107775B|nr:SCP2 sterol-binding domain-containing protein [Methylosinus sp. Sm6]
MSSAVLETIRSTPSPFPARRLREMALAAGADDVGFVALDDPALTGEREIILEAFPFARTLVSFVMRMNRDNVRSPARSAANVEFHRVGDETDAVAHRLARALENIGARAAYPAMAFPMEASRWPSRMWIVAHKPVAVAAGLGRIGIHRNVIHPKFGNFILLGTVVADVSLDSYARPLEFNPCLECKLCVAACPTGAIAPDGAFQFDACYTHNYREFMGGFSDWVESIADAGSARDYRRKVSDAETVSMWQSLAYGPNYKAAYCMAVCPAGEDVISAYRDDRKKFLEEIVDPLRRKEETIYVTQGSDAEDYVARRFPAKRVKRVGNGLRVNSIAGFARGLSLRFQRKRAGRLSAVYHFVFTGAERRDLTVAIDNGRLSVEDGLVGNADLRIRADSEVWLRFLRKEASLLWSLMRLQIRLRGDPRLLAAFGRCFG